MATQETEIERLKLHVHRLLDAEVLRSAEGTALVAVAEAAHNSIEEGDLNAARRHVEQVVLFTEALVRTDALTPADGKAVLATATQILVRGPSDLD